MSPPPSWRVLETPSEDDEAPAASRLPLAIGAIVIAVALGAAAVAIVLGGAPGSTTPSGPSTSASAGDDGALVVEVGGAVAHPGVYRLPPGSRIADAIAAAGGYGPRVAADRVGSEVALAQPLVDGARVVVPSRDATASDSAAAPSERLVDLNRATLAELDALPGIGPVTAQKIVDERSKTPFRTVDELRSRGIVGQKTFDRLKPLLTVGR